MAQVVPAATWLPAVRLFMPLLDGQGSPDHVALTFDDGPHPQSTPQLLDVLADLDVRATFFVLGERVLTAPGLVRDISSQGHQLAVHGWAHHWMLFRSPWQVRAELQHTIKVISDLTGQKPVWFRPPYGVLSGSAVWAARQAGLRPILWSAWGRDWVEDTDHGRIVDTVLDQLRPGGTILLHESPIGGSERAVERVLKALPILLGRCRQRGLRIGPLAEHWEVPTVR